MVGIEDERLMLMLRYFSICFHIPLSNRDVSTNGYFICGFSEAFLSVQTNCRSGVQQDTRSFILRRIHYNG